MWGQCVVAALWADPARGAPVLCNVIFQYDYMGADKHVVTTKMVQLFSYVNSVSAFSWVGEVLQRDGKGPTPKE